MGAAVRVVTVNGLPEGVAGGATVAEVVAFSQGEAQGLNLLAPGDGAQDEVGGVFGEPAGFQGGHGEPILHFERLLTSEIALINQPGEVRGVWSIALSTEIFYSSRIFNRCSSTLFLASMRGAEFLAIFAQRA